MEVLGGEIHKKLIGWDVFRGIHSNTTHFVRGIEETTKAAEIQAALVAASNFRIGEDIFKEVKNGKFGEKRIRKLLM